MENPLMSEATATPAAPPEAPGAPEPAAATAKTAAPKPGDPAGSGSAPEGSKTAVLADLAKERDARQALQKQVDDLLASQQSQAKAIAEAFGLAEAPKSEELAETVQSLQAQIEADRREALIERLAATNGITDPEDKALLTEKDPERLATQAERVGALVKAKAAAEAPPPPAFVTNPGQGQGGQTSTQAQEDAEYAKFYPSSRK